MGLSVGPGWHDEHLLAGLHQSKITACELFDLARLLPKHSDFFAEAVVLRAEGLDQLEHSGQLVVGANQCDQPHSPTTAFPSRTTVTRRTRKRVVRRRGRSRRGTTPNPTELRGGNPGTSFDTRL